MGYMRYPRGMYMGMRPPRGMRPQFRPVHTGEEEEEEDKEDDVNMASKSEEESSDSGGGGGPKSLMSIKITKDVKETVKTQILDKAPKLMAPLGMGLGPRFHLRPGVRPPPGTPGSTELETGVQRPRHPGPRGMPPSAPSAGLLPTPPIHERLGGDHHHHRGGRGGGRGMDHSSRGS